MSAAEKVYPDPPEDKPQWLALAQAVFNSQAVRWDPDTCGGGLRWQIFTFNNGYDYKNTISNGVFFQLGARLARFTGNDTYAVWAERAYDWTRALGLESPDYKLFDGADSTKNCTKINHIQWSYNAGMFLAGSAYMYNYTDGKVEKWKESIDGIMKQMQIFFKTANDGTPNVMFEVACEPTLRCNVDQRSFKAYLSRFIALTIKMAPYTHDTLLPLLKNSAKGAAKSCTGLEEGTVCGLKWTESGFDGWWGLGEAMSALEVIQGTLIDTVLPPATEKDRGTSRGDPSGGMGGDRGFRDPTIKKTTQKDRVGAGFLTTLVLVAVVGGAYWMVA
jgi:mannan endo-1,6-alpha-mannosidase